MPDPDYSNPTLARIEAKMDEILMLLRGKPAPHLTRVQFAKLAGMSTRTVARRIDAGLIRTEKGRIPRTELQKFTS